MQIDLATVPALIEHPTRVFVRKASVSDVQTVADVVAPLVVGTSGVVSPAIRMSSRSVLGHYQRHTVAGYDRIGLAPDYAAFLTRCPVVYEQAVTNDDERLLTRYQHVYAAASHLSEGGPSGTVHVESFHYLHVGSRGSPMMLRVGQPPRSQ